MLSQASKGFSTIIPDLGSMCISPLDYQEIQHIWTLTAEILWYLGSSHPRMRPVSGPPPQTATPATYAPLCGIPYHSNLATTLMM